MSYCVFDWLWSTHPGVQNMGSHIAPCRAATRESGGRAMKSVRTRTRPRVRVCGLVLALGLWLSGLGSASAEPSAECRDLAARFANAPAELDLGALAGLMTCVGAEMQDRTGGRALPPPPRPPEPVPPSPPPAPPPSPAPAPPPSPPPSSFREAWPPSAPWGSPWPSVGPDVR